MDEERANLINGNSDSYSHNRQCATIHATYGSTVAQAKLLTLMMTSMHSSPMRSSRARKRKRCRDSRSCSIVIHFGVLFSCLRRRPRYTDSFAKGFASLCGIGARELVVEGMLVAVTFESSVSEVVGRGSMEESCRMASCSDTGASELVVGSIPVSGSSCCARDSRFCEC